MNDDRSENRDLAGRFDALREADANAAPSFADVWLAARREAASSSRATSGRARTWAAAAAVAAAVVVTAVGLTGRHDTAPSLDESIAQAKELSSWSAPTDTLFDLESLDSRPASDSSRP